jgi:creatinine amidohydrolase
MPKTLKVRWDEMTAPEFSRAVKNAKGVCVVPMGVLEKHGEHLPLGTDLFRATRVAEEAAKRAGAVVFPSYYFGQINEARHQAGTVALESRLLLKILGAVCEEISRNGLKKIILLTGHGGNWQMLEYFCQCALERARDYTVYVPRGGGDPDTDRKLKGMLKDKYDGHAGEGETSEIMVIRPDTVNMKDDVPGRGLPRKGLKHLPNVYSGIWWYAEHPDHYAGQARLASVAKGKLILERDICYMSGVIKAVRNDLITPKLTREFYRRVRK